MIQTAESKRRSEFSATALRLNRSALTAFAAKVRNRAAWHTHDRRAAEIAFGDNSFSTIPFTPSRTTSPQNRDATIGSDHACASNWVKPNPSDKVGKINTSAL